MSRYNAPATIVSFFVGAMIAFTLCIASPTAHADRKSDEARALEKIARVLEGKCKP